MTRLLPGDRVTITGTVEAHAGPGEVFVRLDPVEDPTLHEAPALPVAFCRRSWWSAFGRLPWEIQAGALVTIGLGSAGVLVWAAAWTGLLP